ncbi:MAG: hypothetical protein M1837_004593 [Sclerophora amabilis]|nr:MAG: hypothetical protein M1837_004593 [Sclerophora amabilis]
MSGPAALEMLVTRSGLPPVENAAALRQSNSSTDLRAIETPDPIPEEDEDESSSEAIEPVTPTSDTHPHDFAYPTGKIEAATGPATTPTASKPVLTGHPAAPSTSPPPPPPPPKDLKQLPAPASVPAPVQTPTPTLPPLSTATPAAESPAGGKKHTAKRLTSFFRRSNSHSPYVPNASHDDPSPAAGPGKPLPPFEARPSPRRLSSFSRSARNSPRGSKPNTPPSPGSPVRTVESAPDWNRLSADYPPREPSRSTTGLHLHEKMHRIRFGGAAAVPNNNSNNNSNNNNNNNHKPDPSRKRSTSIGGVPHFQPDNSISMHAATGAGLKARRMSTSLPDDFTVDAVELNTEFTSTSVVPGRRGKTVGSGATASVKLMARKGSVTDEIFAVKEFRKKGKHEHEEDYEKKVKSEFTIAKSLHHPNVVETVRLCTHSGRWNHVMEYCPQGELFSLIQRGYMGESDRLCLFKQLLRGVAYLHLHGIAHRDIKLENLLLTNEGHLKITDFGVSEVFCGEHPGLRGSGGECGRNMKECRRCAPGICGSLPYIAPEVLEKNGEYDPRPLDVWSCALVYLTMRYRGSPWLAAEKGNPQFDKFLRGWEAFSAKNPDQIITDESGTPKCGEVFAALDSQAMRRLLLRMMHPVPEKRIGICDAVGDRWVKTIECCSLENYEMTEQAIDAAGKKSCKLGWKSGIKKLHNHLPPTKRVMSFDLKES